MKRKGINIEEIKRKVTETGKTQKLLLAINDSMEDLQNFEKEYENESIRKSVK